MGLLVFRWDFGARFCREIERILIFQFLVYDVGLISKFKY